MAKLAICLLIRVGQRRTMVRLNWCRGQCERTEQDHREGDQHMHNDISYLTIEDDLLTPSRDGTWISRSEKPGNTPTGTECSAIVGSVGSSAGRVVRDVTFDAGMDTNRTAVPQTRT
jgi:hypothetical protein